MMLSMNKSGFAISDLNLKRVFGSSLNTDFDIKLNKFLLNHSTATSLEILIYSASISAMLHGSNSYQIPAFDLVKFCICLLML